LVQKIEKIWFKFGCYQQQMVGAWELIPVLLGFWMSWEVLRNFLVVCVIGIQHDLANHGGIARNGN